MIQLNNYVSKTLYDNSDEPHTVLTYIDLNTEYTEERVISYIKSIVEKNEILRQYIVTKDNILYLATSDTFRIENHYSMKHISEEKFDDEIYAMLNKQITTQEKWDTLWCVDTASKKTRIYFKIDHTYADGYVIIKILTSPFADEQPTKQFKRTSNLFDTFYYYIIGTIMLCLINIRFLLRIFSEPVYQKKVYTDTDYILCEAFDLQKIKEFTKKENITINDFVYSLMIKANYYYSGEEQTIYTVSPINISHTKDTNNVTPLFLSMKNSYDSSTLLQRVHEMFNSCKYSLFIPCLSSIINAVIDYIPSPICKEIHNTIIEHVDYLYSNIIGPSTTVNPEITNIHFLTTTIHKEMCFNIISYDNAINVICTFKKGVIADTDKFKKAIYKAYNSLMILDNEQI